MENTNFWVVYLPVNTDEVDKITASYEAISEVIMKGYDENKKSITADEPQNVDIEKYKIINYLNHNRSDVASKFNQN